MIDRKALGQYIQKDAFSACVPALPLRSMVGQLTLNQHIGVRIPEGQPNVFSVTSSDPRQPGLQTHLAMKTGIKAVFLLLLMMCGNLWAAAPASQDSKHLWPSEPPPGIPFAASKSFTGIEFTGSYVHYGNADTWFPTWAANGNLYSSWTDGKVNGIASSSLGPQATTGSATVLGDDPLHLTIANVGTYPASPLPYGGRYPAGGLVYNGVWYYGTYLLDQTPGKGLNWDILGPFVGFRYSTDFGKTWHKSPHSPGHPLFDEPAKKDGPVKLGLPHFVDFGKSMEYSPDGKAYIVSQGATGERSKPEGRKFKLDHGRPDLPGASEAEYRKYESPFRV